MGESFGIQMAETKDLHVRGNYSINEMPLVHTKCAVQIRWNDSSSDLCLASIEIICWSFMWKTSVMPYVKPSANKKFQIWVIEGGQSSFDHVHVESLKKI